MRLLVALFLGLFSTSLFADEVTNRFLEKHCIACHDAETMSGGLDLRQLSLQLHDPEIFKQWVKVHDRVSAGEMPPKPEPRPDEAIRRDFIQDLKGRLLAAERRASANSPRTGLRRLTRVEYENTIRDLFEMPGLVLQSELPPDGSAHGFDKSSDALDISHVNLAKYIEAADRVLDVAIATQPEAPSSKVQRISLANPPGFVAHVLMNGDGVLIKNGKVDPEFPAAAEQNHIDQGAHERMGSFQNGASVGLFRHEDESFHPYFNEFVAIYPARYRIRTSLWSFQWDKGEILKGRGTEAGRLSIVTLTGDGRGGGHPSTLLTYLDAPADGEKVHELNVHLNQNDTFGFNTGSLAPVANYYKKRRAMEFTGPGIACDYIDVEGPLYDSWPPPSHKRLFGDLPLVEFKSDEQPGIRPPRRETPRQKMGCGKNVADPVSGIWTVRSMTSTVDASRLLAKFLPRAFRRPVSDEIRSSYVNLVKDRLSQGDSFETAMRWAYRSALCSPDFLYHVETAAEENQSETVDDFSLASRLSYFLWNSMPDDRLMELAGQNRLHEPEVLRAETERLLASPASQQFIDDFLGQWLRLKQISATDPDKTLYPEFSVYLQDSMVAETRAYFRELVEKNLSVSHFVKSDFAMINEKLAVHYGIPGVSGSQIRRVSLPEGSPRGPFLTQAAVLKITANGTTTSPVPRGAFVMDRLLGQPPDPPPKNIAAVEPDVRGATTIREQLAKHRDHAICASCHSRMDPPGFALESFDVIGGQRTRYRSIGTGDAPERGAIDPAIGLGFRLGLPVDSAGELTDGRSFGNVAEFQNCIAADTHPLLKNLTERMIVYATGQAVRFADRDAVDKIVQAAHIEGDGVRTLIHHVIQSRIFLKD